MPALAGSDFPLFIWLSGQHQTLEQAAGQPRHLAVRL
jgi:hypothetical protein